MQPEYVSGNVRARCPDCGGVVTTFEYRKDGRELGAVVVERVHRFADVVFSDVVYRLLKCAGCGRGGLAKLHAGGGTPVTLEWFFPTSPERAKLPERVPPEIVAEVREAEDCMGIGANRAASALLRSALEKTLMANGYEKGSLRDRIDEACGDGVITAARKQRAHDEIRVLGNDVLHEEWREIPDEDVTSSHHYVQRVLEDFYDDRPSVEGILKGAGRIL